MSAVSRGKSRSTRPPIAPPRHPISTFGRFGVSTFLPRSPCTAPSADHPARSLDKRTTRRPPRDLRSRILVHRRGPRRFSDGLNQLFKTVDRLRPQEHVAAHVADLRGNLVDDHDPPAVADGVQNPTIFIVSGTTLDRTFHRTARDMPSTSKRSQHHFMGANFSF